MARFLELSNGEDGVIALGSYTQVKSSCSGTSGATSLSATGSFSAGQRLFIIQMRGTSVGSYEDNQVVSYVVGTITLLYPLETTYTDSGASQAQVVVVPKASGVTGSYTVTSWDGDTGGLFVMACSGVFSGTVTATGKGFRGGTAVSGTVGGLGQHGKQGEGSIAAGDTASTSANGNGGGGGGAQVDAGAGGGGGANTTGAVAGGAGFPTGGSAGSSVGAATLTTLFMGGGGGSGGGESNDNLGPFQSGAGGRGGGIIVVYTNKMTGTLTASGNVGLQGGKSDDGAGSGGGGAGGSILIKGVDVTATGVTSALGAGGSPIQTAANTGGNGSSGRIRIESCSVSGTASPAASESTGGHSYCGGAGFIF